MDIFTVYYGQSGKVLVKAANASQALDHAQARFEGLGLDLKIGVPHTAVPAGAIDRRIVPRLEDTIWDKIKWRS